MTCTRCATIDATAARGSWCAPCERAWDAWVRQHASDIVVSVLGGTLVVAGAGVGLPLLGVGWVVATTGIFGAFATIVGSHRALRRRRRRQFLATAIPRAYLPPAK